jgi:hypothetical protein
LNKNNHKATYKCCLANPSIRLWPDIWQTTTIVCHHFGASWQEAFSPFLDVTLQFKQMFSHVRLIFIFYCRITSIMKSCLYILKISPLSDLDVCRKFTFSALSVFLSQSVFVCEVRNIKWSGILYVHNIKWSVILYVLNIKWPVIFY